MFVANYSDARVRVSAHRLYAAVGGSVVHKQKLEIGEALRENTLDCRADVLFSVVNRNKHCHSGAFCVEHVVRVFRLPAFLSLGYEKRILNCIIQDVNR